MASYNKVIMIGNLTRDPQLSYLPSQTPVVEFGIASNRRWRSKDGQDREDVCFIDCQAYGRMAENISKYCKKGRPLMIEGRLSFDQWENAEGQKRSKHRIFVESFTFVDSRGGGDGPGGGGGGAPAGGGAAPTGDDGPPPSDDDIPF